MSGAQPREEGQPLKLARTEEGAHSVGKTGRSGGREDADAARRSEAHRKMAAGQAAGQAAAGAAAASGDAPLVAQPAGGIFAGLSICLWRIPGQGQEIAKLRKGLVRKHGGRAKFHPDERTTHIVAGMGADAAEIRACCETDGFALSDWVCFVNERWLTRSLEMGQQLDEAQYALREKTTRGVMQAAENPADPWQPPYKKPLCQSGVGPDHPHNRGLIAELSRLQAFYNSCPSPSQRPDDNYERRALAYRRAIAALRTAPRDVRSGAEAMERLLYISTSTAEKIDEYLKTGRIAKADKLCSTEYAQAMLRLTALHGAGPTTAHRWFNLGARSVADLRSNPAKFGLTHAQTIAVDLADDLADPMTRAEAEEIAAAVRATLTAIGHPLLTEICGSLSRGKRTTKDLDLLIQCPDQASCNTIIKKLVDRLKEEGFLTHVLSFDPAADGSASYGRRDVTNRNNDSGGGQCRMLGICRLPGAGRRHRRLDIVGVSKKAWVPALLGWRGSAQFERSLRHWADQNSFHLSNSGLEKRQVQGSELVPLQREEDVFHALGLEYIPPEMRNL